MKRVYIDSLSGVLILQADRVERDAENYKVTIGSRRRLVPTTRVLLVEDDGVMEQREVEAPPPPQPVLSNPINASMPVPTRFQQELRRQLASSEEESAIDEEQTARLRVEWAGDAEGLAYVTVGPSEAQSASVSGELAKKIFAHPVIKSAMTDHQVINLQKADGVVYLQVRKRPAATAEQRKIQAVFSSLNEKMENATSNLPSAFEQPVKLRTE